MVSKEFFGITTPLAATLFIVLLVGFALIPFLHQRYRNYMMSLSVVPDNKKNRFSAYIDSNLENASLDDIKAKKKKSSILQYLFLFFAVYLSSQVFDYLWVYLYHSHDFMLFNITPVLPDRSAILVMLSSLPFYFLYFKQERQTDYYSKALKYFLEMEQKKAPV